MFKGLAILAMLLAVGQTTVPTTGKTADATTYDKDSQKENRRDANGQRLPANSLPVEQSSRDNNENAADVGSTARDKTFISVTNPAPSPLPWRVREWAVWGANLLLALSGIAGVVAAFWAGRIALKDLRATLRPRLIVRRIRLIRGTSKQDGADPWIAYIVIANTGGSRATITRSNLTIDHDRSGILEHAPAFSGVTDSVGNPTLEPGESISLSPILSHDAAGWQRITELIDSEGREQKGWLYCLGFIEYCDTLGIVRSTGFFRKYVMETKRFVQISDQDYEYAD